MSPDYGGHVEAYIDGVDYNGMHACIEGIVNEALERAAQEADAEARDVFAPGASAAVHACKSVAARVRALKAQKAPH
jgi:hypothetical protein